MENTESIARIAGLTASFTEHCCEQMKRGEDPTEMVGAIMIVAAQISIEIGMDEETYYNILLGTRENLSLQDTVRH